MFGIEGQAKDVSASGGEDQVATSIERIATHIGNVKKFAKCASLARQLLRSEQFERKHGKLFMKVL
jgi:bacterioferritin-associated ferredoxin